MTSPENDRTARRDLGQPLADVTVRWAQDLGRNDEIVRTVERKVRRARRRTLSMASVACACLLLGGWFIRFDADAGRPAVEIAEATTSVSRPSTRTLPDGSVVELKEGARLAATFAPDGAGVRRVVLEGGEAHFSVEPDPTRPFVVTAGGVEVRAVGTAFSVAFGEGEIAVVVTEGRVAVERAPRALDRPQPPEPIATLDAGTAVVVDITLPKPAAMSLTLTAAELSERLSWRAPRIRFSDTSLTEAVAAFNRHSDVRLLLDPACADLRIGGVVRADNTDSFLLLLRTEFGIEPERTADGALYLRRP